MTRHILYLYTTLLVAALLAVSSAYAADHKPDVIHLKDGSTITGGRVIEESPVEIKYQMLDEYGSISEIAVSDIDLIEYFDPPNEYSQAIGLLSRGDHKNAYRLFEVALKNYDPEEYREWVPMLCLYNMANTKKVQGMLDADPKILGEAAELYGRLAAQYPNERLIHKAIYLRGVCETAMAQYAENAEDADKHRTEAIQTFEALEKSAAELLKDPAHETARIGWTLRAAIGAQRIKIHSAGAKDLRKLAAEFDVLAKKAPKGKEVEYEALSERVSCNFALAAAEGKGWDEAEKAARALIEQIAAAKKVSANDKAVLITRLYLLIGDYCMKRAEGISKTDPLRREVLLKAAGAYLRPPLLYFANEQTAPEQARALFSGAQALIRLGDTANAYRMLRTLRARYSNSEIWKKRIEALLKTIV